MKKILKLGDEVVSRSAIAEATGLSLFRLDKEYFYPLKEGENMSWEISGLAVSVEWVEGISRTPKAKSDKPKKERKAKDPNAPKKERKAKAKKEVKPNAGVYIVERNMFETSKEFENVTEAIAYFEEGKNDPSVNETTVYSQLPGKPVVEQDNWAREQVEVVVQSA